MDKIVVASSNKGKIKEIKRMLDSIGIEVIAMDDILKEKVDIDESGETFIENAIIKAQTIMNIVQMPTLADDSGLEVDALDKAPGVYSARFLGYDTSYAIKNQYILDAVEGKDRTARFVCAMALAIPGENTISFQETFEGEINSCMEGENGFGYDPIFYFPPLKKTSAQMSMDEKNQYSHRGKALRRLYTILKEK